MYGRPMPLVYLPDVECLFLGGTELAARGLLIAAIASGGVAELVERLRNGGAKDLGTSLAAGDASSLSRTRAQLARHRGLDGHARREPPRRVEVEPRVRTSGLARPPRNDHAAARLRRIVGPFILRRLKSDPTILQDLPPKNEMKVVCTLTREQATLYKAVVDEELRRIESSEGIERCGRVLALLMFTKQICNHPAQYLGESGPQTKRSGKLARTTEMLEEAVAAGDKALVFTQFCEMGDKLVDHCSANLGCEIVLVHGGTPKKARDEMVRRFQEEPWRNDAFVRTGEVANEGTLGTRSQRGAPMSRWSRFGWYESAPKKPPPERGIRRKKARHHLVGPAIEALENVLRGDSARLARGRTYARAGRTHDLVVKGVKVTGSRATPYTITIELTELSAPAWKKAIDGLAKKAQFSAELLAGQMPQALDEVYVEAGVSVFPKQPADLKTSCSCPDWGDPCKHVADTHYVLGEALDRDPFLLFELRGRTKDQVLDALRAVRGGVNETPAKKAGKSKATPGAGTFEVPTVKLGKLKAGDYDKPREPLPILHFSFDEPVARGAVLRQLGAPTAWEGDASPADILAPLVRAAAEAARCTAMAERSPAGESAELSEPSRRNAKPRARKATGKGR